ncbi:MAG: ribonuclease E inhibitor RraB [Pelagimonas sp.]|uniref:ribonuclease E inhibitor RraB n=1 Tax=Pelagimonas sp. TaxID=2073170 RepID=UPI003D6ACD2C
MTHDFAAQKAETFATYSELQDKHGLPDIADVDYFFVPTSADSDWRPLADALSRADYTCEYIEPEDDEAPYLVATLMDQVVSSDGIWIGEDVATRIALDHGFTPDGWGLEG